MPYVCPLEEAGYNHKLSKLDSSLLVRNFQPDMYKDGAPVIPSMQLVFLQWAFDNQ